MSRVPHSNVATAIGFQTDCRTLVPPLRRVCRLSSCPAILHRRNSWRARPAGGIRTPASARCPSAWGRSLHARRGDRRGSGLCRRGRRVETSVIASGRADGCGEAACGRRLAMTRLVRIARRHDVSSLVLAEHDGRRVRRSSEPRSWSCRSRLQAPSPRPRRAHRHPSTSCTAVTSPCSMSCRMNSPSAPFDAEVDRRRRPFAAAVAQLQPQRLPDVAR